MKNGINRSSLYVLVMIAACASLAFGDGEYTGQFETKLLTNPESLTRSIYQAAPT